MGKTSSRTTQRGFTLVEMLAVVTMVGVLATLAVYGVRKYVLAAKSSEALAMVNTIKAHEEAYRDETFSYLDVSSGGGYEPLYPMTAPGRGKAAWWNPGHADYANWLRLGADANGPVSFGYAVHAGAAGASIPSPGTAQSLNFPNPTDVWYVIKAVADHNGDGTKAIVVASSFTREVYVENDSE